VDQREVEGEVAAITGEAMGPPLEGIMFDIDLDQEYRTHLESQVFVQRSKSNRASEIGHPCVRKLVLDRAIGDKRKPYEWTLQSIFNEGRLHEVDVKRTLSALGYDVIRAEQSFDDRTTDITGHIDGAIEVEGTTVAIEIKSMSQFIHDKIDIAEDMMNGPLWVRKYIPQLNQYMAFTQSWPTPITKGLFVLKNKQTGLLKFIWIDYDPDMAAECAAKAVHVNKWLEEGFGKATLEEIAVKTGDELPPECDDAEWCANCQYRGWGCFPEAMMDGRLQMVEDDELTALLDERADLVEPFKRYKKVDAAIKDHAKAAGADVLAVGEWTIATKTYDRTVYDVPAEIKAEYKGTAQSVRVTIKSNRR